MVKVEQLTMVLEKMGLQVERGDRSELVSVKRGGIIQCADGRPSDQRLQSGPKFIGAIEGLAWFIAKEKGENIDEEHILEAIRRVQKTGMIPAVHDMHEDPHCGHAAKVIAGAFSVGMEIAPDRIAELVNKASGYNPHLVGEHNESRVGLNLIPGTTRDPNGSDEAFHADVWYAPKVGVNAMDFINHNAATVNLLRPNALKLIRIYG